jgi:hypothetical protein
MKNRKILNLFAPLLALALLALAIIKTIQKITKILNQ